MKMLFRTKTAPTHYPRIPFHLLRTGQLLSSMIVGAIMCYFMYHLRHDHWPLPWTFIVLLAVSLFTVLALSVTIILHFFFGLNPRLNLFLNGGLLVPWTLGFALLSWWSSGTLSHVCNTANWRDSAGIMVCRLYKALFAFTLTGFLSTVAALCLDVHVYRRSTRLGAYNQMQDLGGKPGLSTYPPTRSVVQREAGPYSAGTDAPYAASRADLDSEEAPKPYKDTPKRDDGYAVPDGQFEYDTGYHGAPGPITSH